MAQQREYYSGTVAADGTLSVSFGPSGRIPKWTVSQISAELTTAPAGSTCSLRESGHLISPMIPTGDTAAGEPSIDLRLGDTLTVDWAGCTPGTVGYVTVILNEVRSLK